jgi:hypothetical protein
VGISIRDERIKFNIHGEFKLSLGVVGEITETDKCPVARPFEAIIFDD